MSLYRNPRVVLLVLLTLLALVGVWQPWRGLSFELRGITTGLDLAGGSRVVVRLDVTSVEVQFPTPFDPSFTAVSELRDHLADELLSDVKVLAVNQSTRTAKFEIGKPVEEDLLRRLVENFGEILSISREEASSSTMDEVISTLMNRIDPAGLLGVSARPTGTNLLLFEIPAMEPEQARLLIEKEGKLEAFIENSLILRGSDIEIIYSVRITYLPESRLHRYELPLRISKEGAKRFAEASAGKARYPFAIYLDRPADALLIFDSSLRNQLAGEVRYPRVVDYSEERRQFYARISDYYGFYLLVSAIPIDPRGPSENEVALLQECRKNTSRAVLLGDNLTFSEQTIRLIENIFENRVEFLPRGTLDISEWIFKACGLQSAPEISEGIAGREEREVEITGTRASESEAAREADELKTVLSQRLTAKTTIASTTYIPPRLGAEFAEEIKRAALAAVFAIACMIYIRYRDLGIVLPILTTMGCELILTIGAASAVRQTIGLAEIGGLLAVIGTGVEHQLIITDEVLRGEVREYRARGVRERVGRAFTIILTAALTTVAAMFMLLFIGFGAMKGFAIITILGVLIAVLITRPAYGEIINAILSQRLKRTGQGS